VELKHIRQVTAVPLMLRNPKALGKVGILYGKK
jgi:hypothetical protein